MMQVRFLPRGQYKKCQTFVWYFLYLVLEEQANLFACGQEAKSFSLSRICGIEKVYCSRRERYPAERTRISKPRLKLFIFIYLAPSLLILHKKLLRKSICPFLDYRKRARLHTNFYRARANVFHFLYYAKLPKPLFLFHLFFPTPKQSRAYTRNKDIRFRKILVSDSW